MTTESASDLNHWLTIIHTRISDPDLTVTADDCAKYASRHCERKGVMVSGMNTNAAFTCRNCAKQQIKETTGK